MASNDGGGASAATKILEIPPEFEPHPAQILGYVKDLDRFRLCFAMTRLIAQRDDPLFCKQLYDDGGFVTCAEGEQIAPPHPSTALHAHLHPEED